MKVNVITRHTPSNYGSLLQSIATINIIESLGHKAEIINYCRADDRGLSKVWAEACLKHKDMVKRLAYTVVRLPIESYAERRFDEMRMTYLPLTRKCRTHKELYALSADVFVTGSDQVWGPMVNGQYDDAYFLHFVLGKKKISYAASFGKTTFDETTITDYKRLLASYDQIAVREDSAVQLLKSWGLSNCVGQVLDPTLLLTGEEWRIFAGLGNTIGGRPYVLVYQLHNNPSLSAYAVELAKKMNMELVRVSPFLHQATRSGRFICCPAVKDFLELINNSSMLVTDSFHGTCFAVNLNKQFVEILPNNATGTRNQSILQLTGLTNRIIKNFSDFRVINNVIDYGKVNDVLDMEREKSLNILKNMLKQ